jgi:hypothetical protein
MTVDAFLLTSPAIRQALHSISLASAAERGAG